MQTFLPDSSFSKSARHLDNRRLNKQITEVKQIALAILNPSKGWQHHPAVNMWRGYRGSLILYGIAMYYEWRTRYDKRQRGGKLEHKAGEWLVGQLLKADIGEFVDCLPSWLGDPAFHASHRAALLYKAPEHYGQFGWTESPAVPDERGRLPYVWPKGEQR